MTLCSFGGVPGTAQEKQIIVHTFLKALTETKKREFEDFFHPSYECPHNILKWNLILESNKLIVALNPDFAAVPQTRSVDAVLWLLLFLIGVFVPTFWYKNISIHVLFW